MTRTTAANPDQGTVDDPRFPIGERLELGRHLFTAEAIIAFARQFDFQRFHIDAEAAKTSLFGALCASGWHTTAVWMRKNIDHRNSLHAEWQARGIALPEYGPSPGFRDLKWTKPVYAGDEITFFNTVTGIRPLASRPGWSILSSRAEADNQHGELVMRFDPAVLIRLT